MLRVRPFEAVMLRASLPVEVRLKARVVKELVVRELYGESAGGSGGEAAAGSDGVSRRSRIDDAKNGSVAHQRSTIKCH